MWDSRSTAVRVNQRWAEEYRESGGQSTELMGMF